MLTRLIRYIVRDRPATAIATGTIAAERERLDHVENTAPPKRRHKTDAELIDDIAEATAIAEHSVCQLINIPASTREALMGLTNTLTTTMEELER